MTSADVVADAIVAAVRVSGADRRLYLREYLGLDLNLVHEAFLASADSSINLTDGFEFVLGRHRDELQDKASYVLKCISTGAGPRDPIIVPFQITNTNRGAANTGSEGFAAALRSAISASLSENERPRILVFLTPQPVDTILTTSDDAASLAELAWSALCTRAVSALAPSDTTTLIKAIAEEMAERGQPEAHALDLLIQFATKQWTGPQEAGASLYELERYVSDPAVMAATNLADRLKLSADWRDDLEKWAAPGNDLDRNLAEKRIAEEVAARISSTLGPNGIAYEEFTLNELMGAAIESGLRWTKPLRAEGAAITTSYRGQEVIIAWLPGGGRLSVLLAGECDGTETATAHIAGATAKVAVDTTARRLRLDLSGAEWVSGTIDLQSEGAGRSSVGIIAFFGEGSWFPIERTLAADVDACAFVVESEPDVIAAGAAGQFLATATLGSWAADTEPKSVEANAFNETWPIPLLFVGTANDDDPSTDGDDFSDGDLGDETDPGDGEPSEGSGRDELDPVRRPPQPSPVHAALHAAESPDSHGVQELNYETRGFLKVGTTNYELIENDIDGVALTDIEAQILSAPRTTSFILTPEGELVAGAMTLGAEGPLAAEITRFLDARESLFNSLATRGSALALGAGVDLSEAREYLDAYAALLEAPQRGQRYLPEFDPILLSDSILIGSSGDIVVAPTNPLSMAFYISFAGASAGWIARGEKPSRKDIAAIGGRHLLPMFHHNDRWYESLPEQPFAWRRYQPMFRASTPADHDSGLIAERMGFFLTVYPTYDDPRQRLSILFRDPSMQTVVESLKRFYRDDIRRAKKLIGDRNFSRPALEVILVSDRSEIERDVRALLEDSGDEVVDRVIRERVAFRVLDSSEAEETFSHIAFLFQTDVQRDPWRVSLDDRAPTTFVGGLATSPGRVTLSSSSTHEASFAWGTFASTLCGDVGAPGGGEIFERILLGGLELIGGQPRELILPRHTRMPTTIVRDLGAAAAVYEDSVWVVHLDRLLGLEAFQHSAMRHLYIIDYKEGEDPGSPGLDAITVTSKVDPYHHALQVALSDLAELSIAGRESILQLLNGVSGRWALQLLRQAPHQVRERIGTVTAIAVLRDLDRCFGEHDTGFGVLVPLQEVWASLERRAAQEPIHPACDDLVYFQVSAPDTTGITWVWARLLEVKYRTNTLPNLAEARTELESARTRLKNLFDPIGVSRLFRGRDLSELIRTAWSRSKAFGLQQESDDSSLEGSLAAISSGRFRLCMDYVVDGEHLGGDVISIEADNSAGPTRTALPGEGTPFGLVRLGRETLAAVAVGERVQHDGWHPPVFSEQGPEGDSVTSNRPEPPLPPDGTASAPLTSSPADAGSAQPTTEPRPPNNQTDEEVESTARQLDRAAVKYGLLLEPFQPHLAQVGPSVIRFRTRPLGKQTLGGVQRLALDLGREIGAGDGVIVDQEAYFITVDVPRASRQTISYADYERLLDRTADPGALEFLVGMAPSGIVEIADLARLPHLLVAGATGSGKSVFLRGLLAALVRARSPEQLQVLLVDPKQVDFMSFEALPHLRHGRIITDPGEAVLALSETIEEERERRLPLLRAAGVTSLLEFYEAGHSFDEMPQIVVLVDEFADLATSLDRDERARFMGLIQRYGQITRAFGIYLVLATQRPSVQVITGDIKANLTARIALKVQAPQDSVTILGRGGAERLRDRGDLIFDHGGQSARLQGFFATSNDARIAVERWRH